ncbi:uncharacterized protein B0H64DRAFT_319377 [Chaetomium fimeti]|uniref:Chromo domain-containing protein n=1 Tax=Chaetomium fimeti TaxID=1854472 RepID=A0AAE0HK60_9PEZI|nr:hypothetical protein B0H64DRAFT_319377 [Chaetomium fimeti]
MFKIDPRAFEPVSPYGDESDDSISVTSTVSGHDPDQEFGVENILAQRQFKDGNMYYLVEWTDFPLHESTWEPESNISADLKAIWEEDKAKHATGELKPFDIQKFEDAQEEASRGKLSRHRRRNRKRKRLGLELTEPFDKNSSDEEAVEETGIETSLPEPTQAVRPQNPQKNAKEVSSPDSATTPAPTHVVGSSQPPNEVRRPRGTAEELPTDTSSAISTKRKQTTPPQTTGYQGTARPTRKASADAVPKSKTRPTISIPTKTAPSSRPTTSGIRKTLTAKKSATQPAGNIFTSGKIRKLRPGLKDTMSDLTKEPKLFAKHRQCRQAYLRSRDKEDIAPNVSQLDLLDLRSKQTISRQSSGRSVLSPTQQAFSPQQETYSPSEPPQTRTSAISPKSTLTDTQGGRSKKKRKSVRFLEDDEDQSFLVQEPEQIDIDGPSTREAFPPPSPRQRPSLDLNRWTPPVQGNQSADKKLVLGQSSVDVTFNGLPREPSGQRAWLSDFLAESTLEFRHTCFSGTAAAKMNTLVQERLASGTITSEESEPSLRRMAENLTAGLLALYYGQAEYNVLIYPTKCDEWRAILPGMQPASPSEEVLGYLIFASLDNLGLMLPPAAPPPESRVKLGDSKIKTEHKAGASARELLVKRIFNFDYKKLLPVSLLQRPPSEHAFFLAIPASRREIGQALYHWLRGKNSECQVFTSHDAGGWDTFRSRVETIPGVVIIHETLGWSLRRFPNLSRYLITRNDEYWCISEPVHGVPLYPSVSIPEYPVPPGDMHLARLFPYRTAIFLTPSFLVSEPRRSLEFLAWFSKWVGKFYYRLVTAYNIHEYLAELAEERYQARQDLLSCPSDMQFDVEANLNALSRDDCSCRFAIADLAADLHVERMVQAGPLAHDEDSSPVIYADSSIDPNDEQSLVNWFGWWATLRADQFRKFHVIGSSQAIKMHGCRRGERRVRIPKYSKVTTNDPDAVLEVLQERNDQVEASGADAYKDDGRMQASRAGQVGQAEHGFNKGRWAFRSNIIQVEDMACFASYLDSLTVLDGSKSQWGLYKFPISWSDLDMATYFGDMAAKYRRISDWFNFTFSFGGCQGGSNISKPPHGYNTYIGFFYTIDEEWDSPDPNVPKRPLERHPWIGIYRPVNPHRRPYGRCELIIWDPAARTRYPNGQVPAEKDLTFMQRQMIQHVRDHGEEKNYGTWLDQVWFGGWDWPAECDSPYPIDVTLRFLRCVLSDIRNFLPAPEPVMESKGWRRVALGPPFSPSPTKASITTTHHPTAPGRSPATASARDSPSLFVDQHPPEDVPMDLDSSSAGGDASDDDDLETEQIDETRVIFHPPRGYRNKFQTGVFRSRCLNRLYEEARLARARARDASGPSASSSSSSSSSHMRYAYVPTMDWYREQKAEGRAFAHVNVESWEAVFAVLKIGAGKKDGAGGSGSVGSGNGYSGGGHSGGGHAGGGGGGGGSSDGGEGRSVHGS